MLRRKQFDELVVEGEHVCGEWLPLAHGTIYKRLNINSIFEIFDIRIPNGRRLFSDTVERCNKVDLQTVPVLHYGKAIQYGNINYMPFGDPQEGSEGMVYRLENDEGFQFAGKILFRPMTSGQYLNDDNPIWNFNLGEI